MELDDETVASYIKRQLSQNVLNHVAGPLISTLFFYGSDETSAWLYMILAKHMYNARMRTVRGGISRITRRLAEAVRVVTERSVRGVECDGDSYTLNGDRFTDVVVAVPGDAVLRIAGLTALLQIDPDDAYQLAKKKRPKLPTIL